MVYYRHINNRYYTGVETSKKIPNKRIISLFLKIITKEPETSEVRLTQAAPIRGRSTGNARPQLGNYNRDGHGPKVNTWARKGKSNVRGGGAGATAQRGRDQ